MASVLHWAPRPLLLTHIPSSPLLLVPCSLLILRAKPLTSYGRGSTHRELLRGLWAVHL